MACLARDDWHDMILCGSHEKVSKTMSSLKHLRSAILTRTTVYKSLRPQIITPCITARSYSSPPNDDRLQRPKPNHPIMETIRNTISENLGKIIPGNDMALSENQFALDQVPDLSGKVALVTGGSEGIGYGSTHTLLSHNISKLFILSKGEDIAADTINAIKEEMGDAAAKKVEWISCDLSDWEQTAKVASEIAAKTDRLDILINNAARGIMTYQLNKHGVDLHMATNHMGHVVLTSHLLPLLKSTAKKGDKVRIVNLASNLHENAPKETEFKSVDELNTDYGPQPQYGRSKLAVLLHAKYLARHLTPEHPNILANAVHPGIVETRQSTEHIHEAYPLGGYAMSVGLAPFKKTQFEGCVSSMYAATMTEKSGQYICPPATVEPGSDKANDVELGERLMDLTWRVVKEKTKSSSADKGCPFTQY
jgi:NAD(P)-dependent dehydrogenase (short-subunit alcohol dehydrogenase family)